MSYYNHKSIICSKENYIRWCEGDYAYVQEGLVKSLLKNKLIDGFFIDVSIFKDIPLKDLYEQDVYLLRNFILENKDVTLMDVWEVYRSFDFSGRSTWNDSEDFDKIPECPKIFSKLVNSFASKTDYQKNTLSLCTFVFNNVFGIATPNSIFHPDNSIQIEEKKLNGKSYVVYCSYGDEE